jgi:hypothetical protein
MTAILWLYFDDDRRVASCATTASSLFNAENLLLNNSASSLTMNDNFGMILTHKKLWENKAQTSIKNEGSVSRVRNTSIASRVTRAPEDLQRPSNRRLSMFSASQHEYSQNVKCYHQFGKAWTDCSRKNAYLGNLGRLTSSLSARHVLLKLKKGRASVQTFIQKQR